MNKDALLAARVKIEDAIDVLERQTTHYGGHLAKEQTSVIDQLAPDVLHRDGRKMKFVRPMDGVLPGPALVIDQLGRWRVVPSYKLTPLAG